MQGVSKLLMFNKGNVKPTSLLRTPPNDCCCIVLGPTLEISSHVMPPPT